MSSPNRSNFKRRVRPARFLVVVVVLLGTWMGLHGAGRAQESVPPRAGGSTQPFRFDFESPQPATADDMHVFDPYIGRFHSKTFRDDESGKTFHYVVEYQWFDRNQSVVKFTISTVVDSGGATSINAQGFYGYDPFGQRLYVSAAMTTGGSGFGSIGEFDRDTHRRVVWARSKTADGRVIYVRDSFEIVDENTWTDVTSIRQGEDGEWREVYRDTFTRIGD